jgi:hypothetical protein
MRLRCDQGNAGESAIAHIVKIDSATNRRARGSKRDDGMKIAKQMGGMEQEEIFNSPEVCDK